MRLPSQWLTWVPPPTPVWMPDTSRLWRLRTRTLDPSQHTLVMGILNLTPDSFSDTGVLMDHGETNVASAEGAGLALVADGADIVDVGGESTRPGSRPVSADEESSRVVNVIEALTRSGVAVSIDTSKPAVARVAMAVGAEIINDITGFSNNEMIDVAAQTGAGVVAMHMQGSPRTMQVAPSYDDVVAEVCAFLGASASRLLDGGVDRARICLDPGIGFGKSVEHNLRLLAHLGRVVQLGFPVLVGASRKGFLGTLLADDGRDQPAEGRDAATGATTALAIQQGVSIIRVHNVAGAVQVARVADAIVNIRSAN